MFIFYWIKIPLYGLNWINASALGIHFADTWPELHIEIWAVIN